MGKTKIEWATDSWNPITGCTKVSSGCANCYSERFAERWRGTPGHPYEQGFDLRLWPDRLETPFRWMQSRRIFVCSMADLFHPDVPFEFISAVFLTCMFADRHTFIILTKRPRRALEYYQHLEREKPECGQAGGERTLGWRWPLPNVWLGVSVEDQKAADERIPVLLKIPAAVQFLSCEPLLGEIDLCMWLDPLWDVDRTTRRAIAQGLLNQDQADSLRKNTIDWVIVGGESGPGARLMIEEWALEIMLACDDATVPCFIKQMGSMWARIHRTKHPKGGEPSEWPKDLRVREFPKMKGKTDD